MGGSCLILSSKVAWVTATTGSANPVEEEVETVYEPISMEDTEEARPSGHKRTYVPVNSQRLRQHAQDLHRSKPDGLSAPRGELDTILYS